ncbi:MAG: hypothetical protein ACTHNN_19470 [Xanthobacteraceae bacterium]
MQVQSPDHSFNHEARFLQGGLEQHVISRFMAGLAACENRQNVTFTASDVPAGGLHLAASTNITTFQSDPEARASAWRVGI